MKYQFFDNDGKVTESEQKSYTDALKFAEERGITCLSMPYEIFICLLYTSIGADSRLICELWGNCCQFPFSDIRFQLILSGYDSRNVWVISAL